MRFRRAILALGILLCISLPTIGAAPNPEQMPATVKLPGAEFASWVDARALAFKNGKFTVPAIHPSAEKRIEWLLTQDPAGGCIQAPEDQVNRVGGQPRANLNDAITSADFVLLGRVTGRSFGFYGMHAGQLLKISVDRVLKGSGGSPVYYAFMPIGAFTVGGEQICASNTDYAPPPEIGAEIFVFTYPPDGELLSIADPGDLVPVSATGELALPRQYATEHALGVNHTEKRITKDDLVNRINTTLNGVSK
jgi:hypothetical protein